MKFYPTGKQAQAIDKYTQEKLGISGLVLMESAARKLAEAVDDAIKNASEYGKKNRFYKKLIGFDKAKDKILSVVESGNNGGDAVAAAWMLKEMGYDTYIYEINGISRKTDSYVAEVRKAREYGVTFLDIKNDYNLENAGEIFDFSSYKVILDGIFGVGLTRDITGVQKAEAGKINDASRVSFVVGVDIPSGISADTGKVLGTAVQCDMTVTFEYVKYGMLLGMGRKHSGDIRCASIGLYVPENVSQMASIMREEKVGMLTDPSDTDAVKRDTHSVYICYEYDEDEILEKLPERKEDSNKGTYGKVLIIAGSREVYGAVYLAAEAAYRVGAGLVKVVTDIRNRDTLCEKIPEAMLLTYDSEEKGTLIKRKDSHDTFVDEYKKAISWADVVLIGPGLGTGDISRKMLNLLSMTLTEKQKLILDADALNLIAQEKPSVWFKELTSKLGMGNVIITPHMMEMLRLVNADSISQGDMDFLKDFRKPQAYNMSYHNGIITVMKDARTIVAYKNTSDDTPEMEGYAAECPLYVNTTGNSGMSKGGSGDVLAGMIAGLLAQNREECSVADIVCAAVHLHGKTGDIAAEKIGERSMIARDIIDAIPVLLK